jgi:hypothetical protein
MIDAQPALACTRQCIPGGSGRVNATSRDRFGERRAEMKSNANAWGTHAGNSWNMMMIRR